MMNMFPIFILGFLVGLVCAFFGYYIKKDIAPSENVKDAIITELRGKVKILEDNLDALAADNISLGDQLRKMSIENEKLKKAKK